MGSGIESKLTVFEIVGIFPTEEYQKCKYYADYLYVNLQNVFGRPKYRPMFDVQWTEYLTKCRRNFGVKFWKLTRSVVVLKNGEYFGNDEEFVKFCNIYYSFHAFENFELMGKEKLLRFINANERPHVFLTISINGDVVGTLLIQLFIDLVPLTCRNFLRLIYERKRGYKKAPIHRIVQNAWIQCGGDKLRGTTLACENYIVPHDQRGVVSTCHKGKHKKNSTQFHISLQATRWMDYYYVAFGQLLHGEDVLKRIEEVPTYYESPNIPIVIEDCGEYITQKPLDQNFLQDWINYAGYGDDERIKNFPDDISDFRDVDSFYSEEQKKKGLYSL